MIYFDVSTLNPEKITGVGVYMLQLLKHFHAQGLPVQPVLKLSRLKNKDGIEKILPQKNCRYLLPWSFYSSDDIYHGPDFKLSTQGRFKRVVTVHDMVVFEKKYNAPDFYHKGIADLTKTLTAERLEGVLVNSEFTKSEVLKHFPHLKEKIHVTYLGCQRDKPVHHVNSLELPEKYILFLGTLEKRKNVVGVIEAFNKFKKMTGAEHKLVLAGGNGFGVEEIGRAIESSEFKGDIVRLYYVSDAHMHELYSRADAFLFPSFYEGFGIPVLEAMALGCPVVSSLGGALEEICADAALLARPDDIDGLARHLKTLVEDSEVRAEITKKAFNRSTQFTWEKCAQETAKVYKDLLGKT